MQNVQIEFFGRLSDRMGNKLSWEAEGESMTIGHLRSNLAAEYDCDYLLQPAIMGLINDEIVPDSSVITSGDVVAFFSPLSGG